jgi:hypothetical protein
MRRLKAKPTASALQRVSIRISNNGVEIIEIMRTPGHLLIYYVQSSLNSNGNSPVQTLGRLDLTKETKSNSATLTFPWGIWVDVHYSLAYSYSEVDIDKKLFESPCRLIVTF